MTSRMAIYEILLALVCTVGLAWGQSQPIEITMDLDRDKIALGETATLSVVVTSDKQVQLPKPELPPMNSFNIQPAGNSTNLQIIDGQVSFSQSYNYILSPTKVGTFPIRMAKLVYNGHRYTSNELQLEVVKTAAQAGAPAEDVVRDSSGTLKNLFVTAEVDKKTAYVDEQVTLVVKFYRAIDVSAPPEVFMPQTPGFWTHEAGQKKEYYQDLNGRTYIVREERQALFPTRPGELTIGETQVRAAVPTRRQRHDPFSIFGDLLQESQYVTLKAPPFTVNVKSLPLADKPADFSGAVGRYDISAQVDKTSVQVNEAISLKVILSGTGNIKSLPEPKLPDLPDFRIEKANSDFNSSGAGGNVQGSKTFEYVLIPRVAGKEMIAPLEISYFDPTTKKYMSSKTAPIELNIQPGEEVVADDVPYNMVSGQTVSPEETGIRHIKPKISSLQKRGASTLTSAPYLSVLILPTVILLGAVYDTARRRRLAGNIGYARLRKARTMAQKRLKRASGMLDNDNGEGFYSEISGVVTKYVADKLNLSAQGLTTYRIDELLAECNIEEDVRKEVGEIIGMADFGRFAGPAGNNSDRRGLYERASRLIVDLEGKL